MHPYLVTFDIAALMLCIVCLVITLLHHRTDKLQNKLFISLLAIIALGSVSSLVNTFLSYDVSGNLPAIYLSDYFYFLFHTALAPLFFYYMTCADGVRSRYSRKEMIFYFVPFIMCEILVIINPLTSWVFYFDADNVYQRGWALNIVYVIALLYLATGASELVRKWRMVGPMRQTSLIVYLLVVLAGVFVQLLFPDVRIELFAEALALMGAMFSIETEDDRIDMETGVYERRALIADLLSTSAIGQTARIVCIRLLNADLVVRMMGPAGYETLMGQVAGWLKSLVPWYRIYRTSPTSFTLMSLSEDYREADAWSVAVRDRFEQPWEAFGLEVSLSAAVLRSSMPDELATSEEVLLLVDGHVSSENAGRILAGEKLDYLKRSSQVERAVARGLEEGNFEVYYQPICTVDGRVCAAEALMRLHDPDMGNVPPDEFIAVAERTGAIDRIGMFALREVCSFLASGLPRELGIECIHVNLSMVQCFMPSFVRELRETVGFYGVDPASINLEITESVTASDSKVVSNMMKQLSSDGFQFSMDDYGTGYSSIHSILAFDFDFIKIDKSILWDAEKSENGQKILKSTLQMMSDTSHSTVIEGVETPEHVNMLRTYGAGYLQGFYFSRPLPKEEFVECVRELSDMQPAS